MVVYGGLTAVCLRPALSNRTYSSLSLTVVVGTPEHEVPVVPVPCLHRRLGVALHGHHVIMEEALIHVQHRAVAVIGERVGLLCGAVDVPGLHPHSDCPVVVQGHWKRERRRSRRRSSLYLCEQFQLDMENPAEKCCGWVIVVSHMLAENRNACSGEGGGVNEPAG